MSRTIKRHRGSCWACCCGRAQGCRRIDTIVGMCSLFLGWAKVRKGWGWGWGVRRVDEAPGKRATEQDRHPNAATSASAQQQEGEEDDEKSNKRPRLAEGAVAEGVKEEETKIAEEDEDSEPSSDENDA